MKDEFNTSHLRLHPLEDNSNLVLCDRIRHHIALNTGHRITFAEYMDMVLYDSEYGYYVKNVKIGTEGDFFTSVHLGADFGELLAEQFVEMWEILGKPTPFSLVEMGAGQGILAVDILKYIQQHYPDFFTVLDYIIVEKSPALRQEQQQRLQKFTSHTSGSLAEPGNEGAGEEIGYPVRWCNLEDIPGNSITGCFFSNELVDAFPVHQLIIKQGRLQEVYVTTGETQNSQSNQIRTSEIPAQTKSSEFIEVTGELSTPRLAEYFDLVSINLLSSAYPDGYRTEVNLAALDWLKMVADKLQRGYLLTIDYGYPASRYYTPARSQGTLVCYYQHRQHDNPYIHIGRQDITAHVDFTALECWGKQCGLNSVGFTQQGLFLMGLGIGSRIAAISTSDATIQQSLQRRDALHQLINPQGLGGFGVLVQSRNLTPNEATHNLKGLISAI